MGTETELNIQNLIQIHMVTDGEGTKGWVHTHGMATMGLPELEIRNVNPLYLMSTAGGLLNHIAQYMLDAKRGVDGAEAVKLNDTFGFGHSPDQKGRFVKLDPIPGDEEHFTHERWALVPAEESIVCTSCAEGGSHVH